MSEKASTSWDLDVPLDEHPWSIGLIVGPSGSGKTSVARELWPDQFSGDPEWDPTAALVDSFPPELGIKDVTSLLTAVGLGSPPAWVRPFQTLSNGEQFRAQMARRLAQADGELIVVDEFTSVVDRQVAKVASHTVQKTIRRTGRKMVAVACHYDIVEWLQPDWVLDMAGQRFTWGSVQPRPSLHVEVRPVDRSVWSTFRPHHYLSGDLHAAAKCFGAFIGDECVAFTSYRHFPHPRAKDIKQGHRLVVLPDYQGLGLGGRLDDWLGQLLHEQGFRYHNTVSHPAMIRYYNASPRWRHVSAGSANSTPTTRNLSARKTNAAGQRVAADKPTVTGAARFRYLGTHSFAYAPLPPARRQEVGMLPREDPR